MSAVCPGYEELARETHVGLVTLAVLQMGGGFGRTDAMRKRKKEVLGGSCGLLHEVGGS